MSKQLKLVPFKLLLTIFMLIFSNLAFAFQCHLKSENKIDEFKTMFISELNFISKIPSISEQILKISSLSGQLDQCWISHLDSNSLTKNFQKDESKMLEVYSAIISLNLFSQLQGQNAEFFKITCNEIKAQLPMFIPLKKGHQTDANSDLNRHILNIHQRFCR